MKVCKFSDSDYQDVVDALVNRSNMDLFVQDETVRKILNDVKEHGDTAVLRLTHQFDRHTLPLGKIRVSGEEIATAYREVKPDELESICLELLQNNAKPNFNFFSWDNISERIAEELK